MLFLWLYTKVEYRLSQQQECWTKRGLNVIIIWICSSALITLYQVRNISCLWRQSTNTKRKKRFTKKNLPHSWLRCACLRVDFCDAHRSTDWRYRPLHARTFRFYSAGSPAPPSPHFHEANGLLVCSSTLRSSLHVFTICWFCGSAENKISHQTHFFSCIICLLNWIVWCEAPVNPEPVLHVPVAVVLHFRCFLANVD